MRANDDSEPKLPPRPQPPDPSECCNSGCDPCVFTLYEDALDRWEERVARLRERHRDTSGEPAATGPEGP